MKPSWSIRLVRALFFALSVFAGIAISLGMGEPAWTGALLGAGYMGLLLGLDVVFARFSLRDFSHATVGLAIGLFCAWLVTRIGVFQLAYFQNRPDVEMLRSIVELCIYGTLSFLGVSFALRSDRDHFAFLIPFVRFRREGSEGEPVVIDLSVAGDGRVLRVLGTGFLSGTIVVPRFVLDELQRMADSEDMIAAHRGKRGLEMMEKLRGMPDARVSVHENAGGADLPVDTRLVTLAREVNARLLTNDEALTRVARLRGITVLSFPELVNALAVELAVGDELSLLLTKPGKERHQAVGYLDNGTMIVVNQAASLIGQSVTAVVCGTHTTSAGRLIFAELKSNASSAPAA
ncbi:MAG: hypothetical protein JNG86_15160 [Verrucomicrobiaceae bacterium]|nr:hypothetical protein [Verrucomicrobiaceae bacterium]